MLINYKKKHTILFNLKKITQTYFLSAKSIFWCLSSFFIREIVFNYDNVKNSFSRKILCINTEKIGDAIMSLDFINSIAKSNNYNRCYYLVQDYLCPLLNRVETGCILIPWNKRKYKYNIGYRLNFLKKLRSLKFHSAINLSPERGVVNDELTLLSGAKVKIATNKLSLYLPSMISKRNNRNYNKFLLKNSENVYESLMNGLTQIGISKNIVHKDQFQIIQRKNLQLKANEKIICIAPYASDFSRSWCLQKFLKLISILSREYTIILLGDKNQRRKLEEIVSINDNVKNFAGLLTLGEVFSVIALSSLFIGNDSGLTHIALYLKIPLVAIIGGGKNGIFFPYRIYSTSLFLAHQLDCFKCNWRCQYVRKYCITELTVEYVFDNCMKILKQNTH